ncbi:unnamed protein product [Prorocentrum cordatum]|uniref:Uncharacterized protein n=1 Tax=Prorocentrum cordatum TaxID=2364126 RepID=A0ABN9VZ73_9DINO|nr:unnamed protein product [Polarella glacialis]
MEDNAFFNLESVSGMCSSIKAAGDFDFLGLTVLRPKGTTISKDLGLRRVTKAKVQEPMPNVWLSSYLVTGAGAAKLLKCIKSQRQNYASKIIDRVLSQQCLSGDKSINAFVIDHHRFFGHSESGGDSRKKLNSKRPSNSTR